MKFHVRSMLGVTLLEIMLVLAIAAMIIVMSVRYYQSASQAQQANSFLQQVQGITATVDSLTVGGGGYTGITQAAVQGMIPGGASAFVAPWGGAMTFTPTATGFTLNVPNPPGTQVCTLITNQLKNNNKYAVAGSCASITYDSAGTSVGTP